MFLASQRVDPANLAASGYVFRYPELRDALENLV
jgi:NAD dependent epimerase/dehydratase family enzyme